MNFEESSQYLYSLGNEVLAMKLGLENIRKLLVALDNPEGNFLKVQIAGTNGKGSTCAFLDAICLSARIKTGLYTSPHLISITERIKIGGKEILEKDFARHATTVRETSEKLIAAGELEFAPTFFEQVTAIALSAFAEAKIELAILETGLGGRFDATTAANAEIAAVTAIDYDHQDILGNSLAEIAAEKAAIIHAESKVVVGKQKKEALKVILKRCEQFDISPIVNNCDYVIEDAPEVSFKTKSRIYPNAHLSLKGEHQFENACIAINLAELLNEEFNRAISPSEIIRGLENAKHAGRLEFYGNILFDGAHNAAGAKALKKYLDEFIEQPITMIFGTMQDKDLSEIAQILFPKAAVIIFTRADNPRSMETTELIQFLPENFDKKNIYQTDTVEEALKIAEKVSAEENLICVTGSLYLVGEAQKLLNNKI